MEKLIITPKTRIGELLDAYPQLEKVLLELSPTFAKLRNPVLRNTIAKVASLQQAAVIGGLKVDELLNRLRKEVGQNAFSSEIADAEYLVDQPLSWFDKSKIKIQFDASPIINAGGSPMSEILEKANSLEAGQIFELRTSFVPAPIIDILRNRFQLFSIQDKDSIITYIFKP